MPAMTRSFSRKFDLDPLLTFRGTGGTMADEGCTVPTYRKVALGAMFVGLAAAGAALASTMVGTKFDEIVDYGETEGMLFMGGGALAVVGFVVSTLPTWDCKD